MSSPFVDLDGTPIPNSRVLGYGRTGVVISRDDTTAVKIPIRWGRDTDSDFEMNLVSLRHEQDIYQRIGRCSGVVPCVGYSEMAIELEWMKNRGLRYYLAQCRPSRPHQLSWFREMARALAHIHGRRVLVADIASRNFLLDSDLSIKFCDFTESTKFPLDTSMDAVDDVGYTVQTDIGQLGAVMYEVVTGERCEFDRFKDMTLGEGRAAWPRREVLPSLQGVWLGQAIERCWTNGAFHNAGELLAELEAISLDSEAMEQGWICRLSRVFQSVPLQPVPAIAAALGAGVVAAWIWRRVAISAS